MARQKDIHEERQLALLLKNDPARGLEEAVARYGGAVRTICAAILGPNREEVEDLLREETLTREEEERILARTLAKAGLAPPREKGEGHRMKPSRFGLMLLAGVVCAGAVVASAAGYFTMNRNLARHLGAGEAEESLVSQAGGDLGQSATAAGWTITASQVLGDKTQMWVLLDVTAPEGTVLPEGHYRLELPMIDPSVTFTIDDVKDEDPADNRITFLLDMSCDSDIRGAAGMLDADKLEAIYYSPEHRNDRVVPVDGAHWQLPFRVESREDTVVYCPGQTVELGGCAVTVETVEAGPLSIVMELTGSGVRELRIEAEFSHASLPSGSIGYRFLDRSGQTIHISGGQTVPHGSDAVTIVSQVEAPEGGPIDPAGAAVLVLGGTEIPLEN